MKDTLSCFLTLVFAFTMLVNVTSCASTKKSNTETLPIKEKQADEKVGENRYIITAPLVKKNFVKKNGEEMPHTEWYVQRSIQDYFIKFCESDITRNQLEEALAKNSSQSLTMEVEFKDGSWDICDGNHIQQTRIGKYMVIHKIIEIENQN
ncbi:MAG: hypothetical protein ACLGGV_08900 [Bacteroidia bacterium]